MVVVVLFLPVLLLSTGLVTDLGLLFVSRNLAYQAAELGALAGAQDVDLNALGQGRLVLLESRAADDASSYAWRNLTRSFPRLDLSQSGRVAVEVYNASTASPARHRQTGRLLVDPTVSVTVELSVPLYFLRPLRSKADLRVHADASVRTKHSSQV